MVRSDIRKNIAVFCAAAEGAKAEYRATAEDLGRKLAALGFGLIFGGAKVGLMALSRMRR